MRTIELQVPYGKNAEWVNGVLTLVDEEVKDNRPVTERIKTFDDACRELGECHPLVNEYAMLKPSFDNVSLSNDITAYLKLRIITAALNEGWEPQFTKDELRYYPYFEVYTQNEIDNMDDKKKSRVVFRSVNYAYAGGGSSYAYANVKSTYASAFIGSRIVFKSYELAAYAGEQFIDIWTDYVFKS